MFRNLNLIKNILLLSTFLSVNNPSLSIELNKNCNSLFNSKYADKLSIQKMDNMSNRQSIIQLINSFSNSDKVNINLNDIIFKYNQLSKYLNDYRAAEIRKYFNETLGLEFSSTNPYIKTYDIIKESSSRNLRKSLSKLKNTTVNYQLKQVIFNFVSSSFSIIIHNTKNVILGKSQLWLSSQQLENMGINSENGFKSTLQSNFFNREVMKTGNMVFFFIGKPFDHQYGKNPLYIKDTVANKLGFVSPYIMYLGQLLRFASTVDPVLRNEFVHIFQERFPKAFEFSKEALEWKIQNEPGDWSSIGDPIPKRLQIAIDALYKDDSKYSTDDFAKEFKPLIDKAKLAQSNYIFSLDDFKILSTEIILKYVIENHLSDNLLRNQIDKNEFNILFQNAFAYFGLPILYEFKIPVALAYEEYQISNTSSNGLTK